MRFCVLLFLFLIILPVRAATYYVATNGNNAAAGGLATPWSNVWYAAKTVAAGDTVNVGPGEFNEFVTNTVSGTAGNSITFQGTRGSGGEWLTILDASTPITNGWVSAPEIGSGVWKQTNMAFATRELTIDHKRVAFAYTNGNMQSDIDSAYVASGLTTGFDLLTVASNAVLTTTMNSNAKVQFWDGIEAMYCSTGSVCYLRLRDGSDPNGLNIRAAPSRQSYADSAIIWPSIKIQGVSNIVWKNFLVRGTIGPFWLSDATTHDITIESNFISGGFGRVTLGVLAHDNIVRNNTITCNYYGYTNPGAWQYSTSNYVFVIRENLYLVSKFLMGAGGTFDEDIYLSGAGNNNIISGNHIYDGLGTGVGVFSATFGATISTNTQIFGNRIERETSVGILISEGETGTLVYSNVVSDCNINMRLHHMDAYLETNRIVDIYRNECWLTNGCGEHFYVHFNNPSGAVYWPEFWIYHNSFSGGRYCLDISGDAAGNGGLPGVRILNNVISGPQYINDGNVSSNFLTNSSMIGAFDYNLVTSSAISYPAYDPAAWFGPHNIRPNPSVWNTNSVPSFVLPDGSPAINSALDLTQTFTINGTNYAALPYGSDVKIGPAWDMGALEAGYVGNMTTLRVGTLRGP